MFKNVKVECIVQHLIKEPEPQVLCFAGFQRPLNSSEFCKARFFGGFHFGGTSSRVGENEKALGHINISTGVSVVKSVINFTQIKHEKKQKWKSLSSHLCFYLD